MFNCVNVSFTSDRRGDTREAVYMNSGYCQLKPDFYFDGGNFTVIAWIKVVGNLVYRLPLMEFATSSGTNQFFIMFTSPSTLNATTSFFKGGSASQYATANKLLNVGQWYHLTVTFDGNLSFYFNGSCVSRVPSSFRPNNIIRNSSFFGKSVLTTLKMNASIDSVKIYGRALNLTEILADVNQ